MADGGFNLRKWRSSSQELCDIISKTEISTDLSTIDRVQQDIQRKDRIVEDIESYAKSSIGFENSDDSQENVVKVLGQNWRTDSDQFFRGPEPEFCPILPEPEFVHLRQNSGSTYLCCILDQRKN